MGIRPQQTSECCRQGNVLVCRMEHPSPSIAARANGDMERCRPLFCIEPQIMGEHCAASHLGALGQSAEFFQLLRIEHGRDSLLIAGNCGERIPRSSGNMGVAFE